MDESNESIILRLIRSQDLLVEDDDEKKKSKNENAEHPYNKYHKVLTHVVSYYHLLRNQAW